MPAEKSAPEYLIVARVRRAHGVRGEMAVEPITDEPGAVFAAGRRVFGGTADGDLAPDAATLHVAQARPFGAGMLVRFREIADRTAAERWRGRYLLLPTAELSEPGEGEAFHHELIGMTVVQPDGARVGAVSALYDLPQGLALEVTRDAGGSATLLPLREEFVREIDRSGRRIVADPPAGLLD